MKTAEYVQEEGRDTQSSSNLPSLSSSVKYKVCYGLVNVVSVGWCTPSLAMGALGTLAFRLSLQFIS